MATATRESPECTVRSCPSLQIRVLGKEDSGGSFHLPDTQGSKSLSKGLICYMSTRNKISGSPERRHQCFLLSLRGSGPGIDSIMVKVCLGTPDRQRGEPVHGEERESGSSVSPTLG